MIISTIRSNYKIILFGFIFTFSSSVGQSFFIGLFNSNIRNELNISQGEFGSIYGIATLCSSILLIWIGKKIDDIKLLYYSIFVVILLSFSSLFFSYVNGVLLLFFGIFFLRLSGQGLMSHTASTAISRYFEKRRGKALSYTWLGMSLGEFLFPMLIVYLLSFIYWRDLWVYISITILLFLPIISFLTIKDINILSRENDDGVKKNERITETILKLISLENESNTYARNLSGGMKRRLLIGKAMVHTPPILVLDEPTAGVDVELRKKLWANILELNKLGVTIILTTHNLFEAETLCERIAILNHGKLLALDTTNNLIGRIETKKVIFKIEKNNKFEDMRINNIEFKKIDDSNIEATFNKNKTKIEEIVNILKEKNLNLIDFTSKDADLEDVFIQLVNNG